MYLLCMLDFMLLSQSIMIRIIFLQCSLVYKSPFTSTYSVNFDLQFASRIKDLKIIIISFSGA